MDIEDASFFMESAFQFALMNNLTENVALYSKASAVYLEDLEKHLKSFMNFQYSEMKKYYEDVFEFFVYPARKIMDNDWDKNPGWNFVFLTADTYNEFDRQKDYFLSFKPGVRPDENKILFIMYPDCEDDVEQEMIESCSKFAEITASLSFEINQFNDVSCCCF